MARTANKHSWIALALLAVACAPGRQSDDAGFSGGDSSDAGHHVGCSPACSEGSVCQNGQCVLVVCQTGETRCGRVCYDLSNDPLHCGYCDHACPTGDGGYTAVCANKLCGLRCADDPEGMSCNSPNICSNGHCCAPGEAWCNGTCIAVGSDPQNCGECGATCLPPSNGTATCTGGICYTTCNSGTACGNACVQTDSNPENCGSCDHACGSGVACVQGQCDVHSSSCTVYANLDWQTCNDGNGNPVIARPGQSISMSANGSWSTVVLNPTKTCGPAGYSVNPSPTGSDYRYDMHQYWGALLWQVGTSTQGGAFNGTPGQTTGSGTASATATATGPVQFRINDTFNLRTQYNDPGSMSVTVHTGP